MEFSQVKVGDRFKLTKAASNWFLSALFTKIDVGELVEIVGIGNEKSWVFFKIVNDKCYPPTHWGLNCCGYTHNITHYLKPITMKATLENGITIELTQEQLASIEAQIKPKKTKEQRFQELLSQVDVHQPKVDFGKYPNIIFWFDKNGNYFGEYNWKNGNFWFSYLNVWKIFESEFHLNFQEISTFLNGQVEEHFKLMDVTTTRWPASTLVRVEEHFKSKK